MGYKKIIIEDFSLFFIGIIVIPIFNILIITQFFQLQSLGAIIFNAVLFCINLETLKLDEFKVNTDYFSYELFNPKIELSEENRYLDSY